MEEKLIKQNKKSKTCAREDLFSPETMSKWHITYLNKYGHCYRYGDALEPDAKISPVSNHSLHKPKQN